MIPIKRGHLITCDSCYLQYIGEKAQKLSALFNGHQTGFTHAGFAVFYQSISIKKIVKTHLSQIRFSKKCRVLLELHGMH